MSEFETKRLSAHPDDVAPDGTSVRTLARLAGGSFTHFTLAPGETSFAVAHRTVEEIWFFLGGKGELWRKQNGREELITVEAGVCVTIPLGTSFQFRAIGGEPLMFVAITMPSWPGADEAFAVQGRWTPTARSTV